MALDLESDLKPKEYYNDTSSFEGYNKPKHTAYIMFSSKKMGEDLVKLGVVPNKTLILKSLPSIPDNLMKHFIRGYIDGDGCIDATKAYRGEKIYIGLRLRILGNYDFLNKLNAITKNIYPHKTNTINKKGFENVYVLTYNFSTAKNILK